MADPLLRILSGGNKERKILEMVTILDNLVKGCMEELKVRVRPIKPTVTRPTVIVTVNKEPMIHCGATYWENKRVEVSHDCWNLLPTKEKIKLIAHELIHVYSEDPEIPEEKVWEVEECVLRKIKVK